MAKLKLAQVGCGGMGLRHIYAQMELQQQGFDTFDLVALCDMHLPAAEHVADEAEKNLGKRPKTYANFDEMIEEDGGLDAVDIVTSIEHHHVLALKAFEAGIHVAVEKPMGITVRACKSMIKEAAHAQKVLSISENYRRDPVNRLVKSMLDTGVVADPRLFLSISTRGSRHISHTTAWRHMKLDGGYLLDHAVHTADLLIYFLGSVDTVYAATKIWEKQRYTNKHTTADPVTRYYDHRVKEEIERSDMTQCTSEDTALAVLQFNSQAMGHLTVSGATPGKEIHEDTIYCAEGSLKLSGSRSGRPPIVTRMDKLTPLPEAEILKLVPQFLLDDTTATFFGGLDKLSSYDMSFEEIDRKLIAIELQDFADAVLNGREPEVTGASGLEAVALVYAMLESGYSGVPVSFADVATDQVNTYQQEINDSVGL